MCPSNDLDNELTEIEYPLKSLKIVEMGEN